MLVMWMDHMLYRLEAKKTLDYTEEARVMDWQLELGV